MGDLIKLSPIASTYPCNPPSLNANCAYSHGSSQASLVRYAILYTENLLLSGFSHSQTLVLVLKELVNLLKFVGSPLSESEKAYDDEFISKLQVKIQEVKRSREMGQDI